MAQTSIVVGVDDSAESRRAVALAWKLAQAAGAPLVPVHAVPDLWLAGGLDEMPVMLAEIRNALLHDSLSQIERLLTAGARNYLTKPFDIDPFLAVVDEMVSNRALASRS